MTCVQKKGEANTHRERERERERERDLSPVTCVQKRRWGKHEQRERERERDLCGRLGGATHQQNFWLFNFSTAMYK